jgi:hypothetical protein
MKPFARRLPKVLPLLLVVLLAAPIPGWAQAKPDLTIALSSFSTETLDPALAATWSSTTCP